MMPAETIARRDDMLLIVIDEQERLTAVMDRREEVVAATARLVRTAALVGAPIVVTRQYPKGLGETEPELLELLSALQAEGASVTTVDKVAFDCFGETGFVEALAHLGRRQLVIVGMETHICVTQTTLSALREGYDVQVVADACCSRDDAAHAIALQRIRGAGAVVTLVESVMYELVGEAGTDEFRALLRIVKG
jgi:nicotinamidase-related amidase